MTETKDCRRVRHTRLTAAQRSLRARRAALARWSSEADPYAATLPARQAWRARFEDEVDPDRVLPSDERARRADRAMRAYMQKMAMRRLGRAS